jgi:protein ImuB
MARMLAIWCPDWPVAAAGVPSTEPVAVLDAGRVLACSTAARVEGVRPGQRRRQAQECYPGLELIAHDPDRDARAFEPVLVAVESLTPRIEVLRPGECAFPARGAARYHGGEAALTAVVLAAVDQVLGVLGRCQVGIADGRFAAGLAARAALRADPALRTDPASRTGHGPGTGHGPRTGNEPAAGRRCIVPPGEALGFLASFPVEVLERPELTDLLTRLGLRTLGDIATLPRAVVAARFGPEGIRAHRLAAGLDEHPRSSRRPPPDLGVVAALDPPVARVDVAAFAAKALADELVDRLEWLGLACTRLRIEVETEHGEMLARVWRHEPPARPSRRGAPDDPRAVQVASIAERVRWQLDGWLTGSAALRPTGAITRLALIPDEAVVARGRQLGFWGEETEASRRAARALARVQGLLGPEAVRLVSLRGGRDPADRVVSVAEGELPSPPSGPTTYGGSRPGSRGSQGSGRSSSFGPEDSVGPGDSLGTARSLSRIAEPDPTTMLDRATKSKRPAGATPKSSGDRRASRAAPWPGRIPEPSPAIVHPEPVPAEVQDAKGAPVTVNGRGLLSAEPGWLRASGSWARIVAWAGPWPVDERWWDPVARQRLTRLQVTSQEDVAYLLKLADGRWWIEATYD